MLCNDSSSCQTDQFVLEEMALKYDLSDLGVKFFVSFGDGNSKIFVPLGQMRADL